MDFGREAKPKAPNRRWLQLESISQRATELPKRLKRRITILQKWDCQKSSKMTRQTSSTLHRVRFDGISSRDHE